MFSHGSWTHGLVYQRRKDSGKMKRLLFCLLSFGLVLSAPLAFALAPEFGFDSADNLGDEDRPDAPWITYWYTLDGPITETGGFDPSSEIDWIDQGTGGALTEVELSTWDGLQKTLTTPVVLPDNGGTLNWTVGELDMTTDRNISVMLAGAGEDLTNIECYAVIVIGTSSAMTATMSPAHDDFAHIWINGEKIYANSAWTGGVTQVDYDVEVSLEKGRNVLLFRTGESGGGDYMGLHFDDATTAAIQVAPSSLTDAAGFLEQASVAVEPAGKLSTVWGDLKQ
jgi:hypothetical protein